ncbi:MAG: hypothetical protein WC875_01640 [Candidatus Absconditabacterales bacterium]|jgi:hypothetical protein
MKTFLMAIILTLGVVFAQQTNAQKADSLMLKDKAKIREVQAFIIDTKKKLQDSINAPLSREDQIYILDLFSEMTRITLSFYPPDSSTNRVIISKDVKEQMKEDIRISLKKKLEKEKKK